MSVEAVMVAGEVYVISGRVTMLEVLDAGGDVGGMAFWSWFRSSSIA